MKKYILAIGLVAFLMTSCCDKKENKEAKDCCKGKQEQCDHQHGQAPCPEMMAHIDMMINALANWNDLDEAQRADLIEMAKKHVEMKANMPKPDCCKEKHEGKCEKHEGCQKHEGECKKHEGCKHECKHECEHKDGHKCEGKHEGCKHECKHEEGKKCDGNHEKCEHQHEGCQHNK